MMSGFSILLILFDQSNKKGECTNHAVLNRDALADPERWKIFQCFEDDSQSIQEERTVYIIVLFCVYLKF